LYRRAARAEVGPLQPRRIAKPELATLFSSHDLFPPLAPSCALGKAAARYRRDPKPVGCPLVFHCWMNLVWRMGRAPMVCRAQSQYLIRYSSVA
jgi:hypothetical protein